MYYRIIKTLKYHEHFRNNNYSQTTNLTIYEKNKQKANKYLSMHNVDIKTSCSSLIIDLYTFW